MIFDFKNIFNFTAIDRINFNTRLKINLVGNSFSHISEDHFGYSVHGKVSRFIEWEKNLNNKISFYVDDSIKEAFNVDEKGKSFAWLLESNHIISDIILEVKQDPQKFLNRFDQIFTHDSELLKISNKFKWVPAQGIWIKRPRMYEKSKLISMIASNKLITPGHYVRKDWIEKLKNKVDFFGRGYNEIKDKEQGLCDYMFSVVIENGKYDTYFTEKILDCFATGTIPIYYGTDKIYDHFNKDGIILLEDKFVYDEAFYYNNINAVKENLKKAMKFEVLEDFIYENYLITEI
jgi:hypothetical protein